MPRRSYICNGISQINLSGITLAHGNNIIIRDLEIANPAGHALNISDSQNVLIENVIPKHLESITAKLIECGVVVEENDDSIRIYSDCRPNHCSVKTMPHPGFPTDMQPQFSVLLSVARGNSMVSESVWDNRFRYIEQLMRMGAKITVDGKSAFIKGVDKLHGAPVIANDLRAGAAMVIAGLMADGETTVGNIKLIDRGYESLVEKLTAVGADISRANFEEE